MNMALGSHLLQSINMTTFFSYYFYYLTLVILTHFVEQVMSFVWAIPTHLFLLVFFLHSRKGKYCHGAKNRFRDFDGSLRFEVPGVRKSGF